MSGIARGGERGTGGKDCLLSNARRGDTVDLGGCFWVFCWLGVSCHEQSRTTPPEGQVTNTGGVKEEEEGKATHPTGTFFQPRPPQRRPARRTLCRLCFVSTARRRWTTTSGVLRG